MKLIMSAAIVTHSLPNVKRGKLYFIYKTGFETHIYLHSYRGSIYSEPIRGFILWFKDKSYNYAIRV
jgi:hypothetical protein